MLNSLVPSTIDASVKDCIVTVTRTANWQYQREAAEGTVANGDRLARRPHRGSPRAVARGRDRRGLLRGARGAAAPPAAPRRVEVGHERVVAEAVHVVRGRA